MKPSISAAQCLHAVDEVVVADDGGDGGAQARRGRDQRLGDAGRHDRQARRALRSDAVERGHDAPHRAEEADEGRGAGRGGQERQVALELRDLEAAAVRRIARCTASSRSALSPSSPSSTRRRPRGIPALLVGGRSRAGRAGSRGILAPRVHEPTAVGLAEDRQEVERLPPYPPELPPLLDDERPAHDREQRAARRTNFATGPAFRISSTSESSSVLSHRDQGCGLSALLTAASPCWAAVARSPGTLVCASSCR